LLHRRFLGLDAEEWKMLENPSQGCGISGGIAGTSEGIESETNSENSAYYPMRYAVTEKVEKNPGCDHGYDRFGLRVNSLGSM